MPSPHRDHLADVLLASDPGAATLCEGWDVRDLAVHLVVRDGRPDALPGQLLGSAVPALGRHTRAVEQGLASLPLAELVRRFRAGPPRWSPARLPGAEGLVNGVEFWVHAQDVVRARPGWEPEPLLPGQREALWKALRMQSRLMYRSSDVGVELVVPAGPRTTAKGGTPAVTVTGEPEELLLHAFGRTAAARVEVTGAPADVQRFHEQRARS